MHMLNLLPEKEKKELEIEEIAKKLSLVFLFLFVFLLVLIFLCFSLKVYILSQVQYSQDILESKEEVLGSSQFQDFKKNTKETNQNLSKIQDFYANQIFLAPFLEKLSNLTPQTIHFTNLSFKTITLPPPSTTLPSIKEEILAEVHIAGQAETRQELFFFKKDLEEEEEFKDVYFSLSSWVTPTDIEFSLSLKYEP